MLAASRPGWLRAPPTLNDLPAIGAAVLIGAPVLAACLGGLLFGGGAAWDQVVSTRLVTYLASTLGVLLTCAALVLAAAIPAAWLVSAFDFPGRRIFDWALVVPLAAPGYVIAYSYADLLGVSGPFQSAIRDATGLAARDFWFPDVYSVPGCAFVLAACLYPYVYLSARAAFTTQSVCALEAARSLGAGPARAFWQVALPGARPAIAAGLSLALMEAAADYGAADFLGVPTLTVGLVRTWSSFGDAAAAARLSVFLIAIALAFQWMERRGRGQGGIQASSIRWRDPGRIRLGGLAAMGASLFCFTVFATGFLIPVARLAWIAIEQRASVAPLGDALWNSVLLAGMGAAFAFLLAVVIALGARRRKIGARLGQIAASAGYAVPGAVLAVGGLMVLSILPLSLTGGTAVALLVWIYASRFTAAGAGPMEAALMRSPASLGHAARSLGAGPLRQAWSVDRPIALSGAAIGALILFVETLKELPATLMLRPFNWDTLAVRAHAYASDERLAAAAAPSLLITLAGLGPILILCRQLARARPGGQ
ncbi:MAG: iron ABC transporter permease [Pseudomonadota bacterium]